MAKKRKTHSGITAEIIADSIAPDNSRLTTFVLRFPRIVLAEFNTHRVIDRNSASSRAIPYKKMLSLVWKDPFIPAGFQENHKGMQGTSYLSGWKAKFAKFCWLRGRDAAIVTSWVMSKIGVTKQVCNRVLEPWLFHTAIATASEWENFFALRAHEAAEIHIQDLAYKMLDEYNKSEPVSKKYGEWHIPFGDKFDENKLKDLSYDLNHDGDNDLETLKIKVAVARCGRVSYLNFEGKDDYRADINLHDRLLKSGHMSPFGHCAKVQMAPAPSNLKGHWEQYRKMLANENRSDDRVEKKKWEKK